MTVFYPHSMYYKGNTVMIILANSFDLDHDRNVQSDPNRLTH